MDIWKELYETARAQYRPQEVSPFVYAHHVVCALESGNGEIYTGFCIESCAGVMVLCDERVAARNGPAGVAGPKLVGLGALRVGKESIACMQTAVEALKLGFDRLFLPKRAAAG